MKRLIYRVPDSHLLLYRRERPPSPATQQDDPSMQLADELFEVLFTGGREALPTHEEHPNAAQWARAIHSMAAALPIFERLSAQCRGNVGYAVLATEELMDSLEWKQGQSPRILRRELRRGSAQADAAIRQLEEALAVVDGAHALLLATSGDAERKSEVEDYLDRHFLGRHRRYTA